MFGIGMWRCVRLFVLLPVVCLLGGCPPVEDEPTPPEPRSDVGIVAYLTADETTLTVGQSTTARLWVQQTSPNAANDNGVFAVAVSIEAGTAGIVESLTPVVLVAGWDDPIIPASTGVATSTGGIEQVTTTCEFPTTDRTQGLDGPVQVFHFQVKAMAAGTVSLAPMNFVGNGYEGILDWDAEQGDDGNYVPVEIHVQ